MFVLLNLFLVVAYIEDVSCDAYCKLDDHQSIQYCFDPGYIYGLRRCNSYEAEDVIVRPGCSAPGHRSNSSLPPKRCVNGNWENLYTCKPEPVNDQSRPHSDRPTQQTDRAPVSPLDENPSTTRPVQTEQPVETPRPQVYEPPSTTRPVQTEQPVETSIPQEFEYNPSSDCGVPATGVIPQILVSKVENYPRGKLPWIVAIYKDLDDNDTLSFVCGGTLVSDRHVVTAARCMRTKFEKLLISEFVIIMGAYLLGDWSSSNIIKRAAASAAIHDSYDPETLDNDLLVFTLDRRVVFTQYIRPVCLWTGDTAPNTIAGAIGVAVGWGDQSDTSLSDTVLKTVRLPILSNAACTASNTARKTLCAGKRDSSSCKMDFGGGLYLLEGGRWRLRGVASRAMWWGTDKTLCHANQNVVFTDTAHYQDWIQKVINHD